MRSSAWPFGKATFIRIILDILGSWRLVKTSAMNLYFTRWARAMQEYIIPGAMQISFDSPPWWWHHDIWYLLECNASSKLIVVTLSVNIRQSTSQSVGILDSIDMSLCSSSFPWFYLCQGVCTCSPIWLWKKPPQHPDNLVRLLVDENVTHPDLRRATRIHEIPCHVDQVDSEEQC